jgi:hypothetical protein
VDVDPPDKAISSSSSRTLDHLVAAMDETVFTFSGFSGANLSHDGMATVTPDGLLMLTNCTTALMGTPSTPPHSAALPWCERTQRDVLLHSLRVRHHRPVPRCEQGMTFVSSEL